AAPGGEGVSWSGRIEGALATSTTRSRRWRTDDGREAHHLIDPRTGTPAAAGFDQVSVFAPSATEAEIWAKSVVIGGATTRAQAEAAGLAVVAIGAGRRSVHEGGGLATMIDGGGAGERRAAST